MARKDNQRYLEIINSTDYKNALLSMAEQIKRSSLLAPNEATVESYFERELFSFFRERFGLLGFEYNPVKEQNAARHTLMGRADSALSSLIIEFKQPATLKSKKQQNAALKQVSDYMDSLYDGSVNMQYGFVTDGTKGSFVEFVN